MPEQFSLFERPGKSLRPRPHRIRRGDRKWCVFRYGNGAIVNGTQDRYGIFWLVKITHNERVAFTTVHHEPEKGDQEIERLINSLANH